jgi:hypothetical protein
MVETESQARCTSSENSNHGRNRKASAINEFGELNFIVETEIKHDARVRRTQTMVETEKQARCTSSENSNHGRNRKPSLTQEFGELKS